MLFRAKEELCRIDDFVSRDIAGELVIVPTGPSVACLDSVFTLNEVGARIWSLLASPVSVEQIEKTIAAEFDASAEQLASDIGAFLTQLADAQMVRRVAEKA